MSNYPGLYINIGKKARDLLYRDYAQQPPVHFHYGILDCNFDLACKIKDILPGLNTSFRFITPDSGKAEVQYGCDYAAVTGGFGLKAISLGRFDPLLKVSGVLGNNLLALGTDLAFDVVTGMFTKCDAGLNLSTDIFNASVTSNDMFDTLKASCYYSILPLTNTGIAAELKYSISVNETTLSIGAQHDVLPFTSVKGRVNSDGKASTLIRQNLWETFYLTVSGEVDFWDLQKIPKFGLSLALRNLFNPSNGQPEHTSLFTGWNITFFENPGSSK